MYDPIPHPTLLAQYRADVLSLGAHATCIAHATLCLNKDLQDLWICRIAHNAMLGYVAELITHTYMQRLPIMRLIQEMDVKEPIEQLLAQLTK